MLLIPLKLLLFTEHVDKPILCIQLVIVSAAQVLEMLRRGAMSARALQVALNVSQPTISRWIRDAGPRVLKVGQGRTVRYLRLREVRGLGSAWPVSRIGSDGNPRVVGELLAAWNGWVWRPISGDGALIDDAHRDGLFEGWPWFLADLRPSGFMGRAFARRYGTELGLSSDPRSWSDDDVLVATLAHGQDLPGDFVIGVRAIEAAQRAMLAKPTGIDPGSRATEYVRLADQALAGETARSSAGGDQPKFTARLIDGRQVRDVIVKFTAPTSSAAGRRWADLLVCEHIATAHLRNNGYIASSTEWLEAGGRAFLEVSRFDRQGACGRRGWVSLAALDTHLYGDLGAWNLTAARLAADGWIAAADAAVVTELHLFGTLIGNTDMHSWNMGFLMDEARPLSLAPVYDMLPMSLSPSSTGEIRDPDSAGPDVAPPGSADRERWSRAARLATGYWDLVANDRRISEDFRVLARSHASAVRRALDQWGHP